MCKILNKISKKNEIDEIFNIGSGQSKSIDKIIKFINKKFTNQFLVKYVNLPNKELVKTKASVKKIKKFVNYNKFINLENSLKSHFNL